MHVRGDVGVGVHIWEMEAWPRISWTTLGCWRQAPGGCLRETALRLHELTDLVPDRIHLSAPKSFRNQPPKGVVLHKARLEDGDVEDRRGCQVTTSMRTILEMARNARVIQNTWK